MSLVAGVTLVGALAACGSSSSSSAPASSGSSSATSEIKVASIATITGAASFSGWQLGAKAYFDAVNRSGGINGHKIDFQVFDDGGSPTTAASLARKEVDAGVVGFAGSVSLEDCSVNGPYYDKVGIVSIDVGSAPVCWENPDIAPVNSGPEIDPELQMLYAARVLHDTKICLFSPAIPGEDADFSSAIDGFQKLSGLKLTKWVKDYPVDGNVAPAVLELKNAGCQAVSTAVEDTQLVPLLTDASSDNIHDITWISGLAVYGQPLLTAAGKAANNLYLGLEFAPFTDTSPAVTQMLAAFKADDIQATQPEESSYTAAWVFGQVLKSMKGPITRATVLAAFRSMKPLQVPFIGTPFTFGTASAHHPNKASFWVKVVNDKFVDASSNESYFGLSSK